MKSSSSSAAVVLSGRQFLTFSLTLLLLVTAVWHIGLSPSSRAASDNSMFSICYVTAPSAAVADTLASTLVKSRLAACVNIIPGIKSVYTWQGKVEKDEEVLLMIKTQASLVPQLTEAVKKNHPYDVPEVISVPMGNGGNPDYFKWILDNTGVEPPAAAAVGAAGTVADPAGEKPQ